MISVSRRVYLYWLLLLVPTLAAGVGALWLLKREQVRLDEQARAAMESRQASIQARARLIAENVELFVGDVQTGLMKTLREVPANSAAAGAFSDDWERSNPLVSGTFRVAPDGTLSRPGPVGSKSGMRRWLNAMISQGVGYFGTTRTLDQHVAQLRRKVAPRDQADSAVVTVHGVGYRYDP